MAHGEDGLDPFTKQKVPGDGAPFGPPLGGGASLHWAIIDMAHGYHQTSMMSMNFIFVFMIFHEYQRCPSQKAGLPRCSKPPEWNASRVAAVAVGRQELESEPSAGRLRPGSRVKKWCRVLGGTMLKRDP